jgi:hypothetical protein
LSIHIDPLWFWIGGILFVLWFVCTCLEDAKEKRWRAEYKAIEEELTQLYKSKGNDARITELIRRQSELRGRRSL